MASLTVSVLSPSRHCFPPNSDVEKVEEESRFYNHVADVVPTLPVTGGPIPLHKYQGFWYTTPALPGVLAFQHHFQALPTDVLLSTYPRSGTTWFKALIFSTLNRHVHNPTSPSHPLLSHNPHELTSFLEFLYATGRFPDLSSLPRPRFFATHVPYVSLPESIKRSACKIVHVYRRNTRANAVSLWRLLLESLDVDEQELPLERAMELYAAGMSFFGPAWENVGGYWNKSLRDPERVLFLVYEEAEENPVDALRRVAGFLGCPFSQEEELRGVPLDIVRLCSYERLSKLAVNESGDMDISIYRIEKKLYFRKPENRRWVGRLSSETGDLLDRLFSEKIGAFDLKRKA